MTSPDQNDPRFSDTASALPSSLDAEQSVLGAVMEDGEVFHSIIDLITPEAFYEPYHQRLFEAVTEAVRSGRVPEPTYLSERMTGDPAFEAFGGLTYLVDLMMKAPAGRMAPHYAEIVADLSLRRRMIQAGQEIIAKADDRDHKAMDLSGEAERLLGEVSASGPAKSAFESIGSVFARQYKRSRESDGAPPGLPIGIPDLDKKLGGVRKKNTILLGGRPGAAKSAVAVQWAINMARPTLAHPKGIGVAFYSLEMPEEQLATRFGCALAYDRSIEPSMNPTYEAFERGELTDIQWQKLEAAGRELATMPIAIDFRSKMKVSHIMASARRLKRKWDAEGIEFGMIIIDHVLQVQPEKRINDKVQEIGQIADDLMDVFKTLDVAGVVLCQLGREVDKREDKRPVLSDLKWSGSLEENAAVVVMLYRPEYYNRKPEDSAKENLHAEYERIRARYANRILFLIEKNRNGRPQQSVEAFCNIGCNAIQNLSDPDLINRTIDFSKSRIEDPDLEFAPRDDDYGLDG